MRIITNDACCYVQSTHRSYHKYMGICEIVFIIDPVRGNTVVICLFPRKRIHVQ